MRDRVRIVDMAKERNRGGPVAAAVPSDRAGVAEQAGDETWHGWRWVLLISLLAIGLMWLVPLM